MGQGISDLTDFSQSLEELAKSVYRENPDKDTQGVALCLLAEGYQQASDFAATLYNLQLTFHE